MDEIIENPSVARGDTDPEGVKNQIEESLVTEVVPPDHADYQANSKVEMVPPPIN